MALLSTGFDDPVDRSGLVLVRLMGEGSVKPVIDRVFPLDEGRDAMAHYLSGSFAGKIVITM